MKFKTIIQLSSAEEEVIKSLLSQVKNLKTALGDEVEILIVCHAKSIDFVLNNHKEFEASVRLLLSYNVTLSACENMLMAHHKTTSDLHQGIATVPSAIATLVVKQQEGWSYIKAGF